MNETLVLLFDRWNALKEAREAVNEQKALLESDGKNVHLVGIDDEYDIDEITSAIDVLSTPKDISLATSELPLRKSELMATLRTLRDEVIEEVGKDEVNLLETLIHITE